MTGYRVAVPSLGRPDSIVPDTLTTLIGAGVPASAVTVLAGGPGAVEAYQAAIRPAYPGVTVLPSPAGLAAANARIAELWPGEWVVRADDDLRALLRLAGDRLTPVTDADALFTELCAWADRESVTLWGVSPTSNALFMRGGRRTGLYFAFGPLTGYRPSPALTPAVSAKDDYERTLLHFTANGAVGRANDIAFKTRMMRRFPGGLQAEHEDRRAAEWAATDRLLALWPSLVHRKPERDGYLEIALRLPKMARR